MRVDASTLGAVIKAARLKKGWTQDVLAEAAGIGVRHIMGIENEGSSPSYEVLYSIIRGLNIPADSIFYPEKNPSNPQLEYLVHLLGQCGDRDIRAVTALAEVLMQSYKGE
jgi:transcriptional regulator with XRE-family HTH domain